MSPIAGLQTPGGFHTAQFAQFAGGFAEMGAQGALKLAHAGEAPALAGISMTLGTFLAGVLLADSVYRHELESNIAPFEGLLLGLFFIAVGMGVDLRLLIAHPWIVCGLVVLLLACKAPVVAAIARFDAHLDFGGSLRLAVLLAGGGEFAFVVFKLAFERGFLSADQHRLRLMDMTSPDGVVRETFHSSLKMARLTLQALGFAPEAARARVNTFREHDEQLLRDQHLVYDDEAALMRSSKEAYAELERLFEADASEHATAGPVIPQVAPADATRD